MSDSAEIIGNRAAEAVTGKAVVVASSGTVAAGASSAPTNLYGEYLTANGIYFLSYAEWIQVLGAIYVFTLLCRTVVWPIIKKLKGLLRNEKTSKINIEVRSKP